MSSTRCAVLTLLLQRHFLLTGLAGGPWGVHSMWGLSSVKLGFRLRGYGLPQFTCAQVPLRQEGHRGRLQRRGILR